MDWAPHVAAAGCGAGPTPGALALQAWLLDTYGRRGAVTGGGIYNCRRVLGSQSWSLHAEGRALDLMVTPGWVPVGDQVLAQLGQFGLELGLQRIIWWHQVYDHESPGGRDYYGTSPHTDHLHIELTWPAAHSLTVERIAAIIQVPLPDSAEATDMRLDPVQVLIPGESAPLVQVYAWNGERILHVTNIGHLNGLRALGILSTKEPDLCTPAQFDAAVSQLRLWGFDLSCPCAESGCRLRPF